MRKVSKCFFILLLTSLKAISLKATRNESQAKNSRANVDYKEKQYSSLPHICRTTNHSLLSTPSVTSISQTKDNSQTKCYEKEITWTYDANGKKCGLSENENPIGQQKEVNNNDNSNPSKDFSGETIKDSDHECNAVNGNNVIVFRLGQIEGGMLNPLISTGFEYLEESTSSKTDNIKPADNASLVTNNLDSKKEVKCETYDRNLILIRNIEKQYRRPIAFNNGSTTINTFEQKAKAEAKEKIEVNEDEYEIISKEAITDGDTVLHEGVHKRILKWLGFK